MRSGVVALLAWFTLAVTVSSSSQAAEAPLRFFGNTSTIELAPVLLAAERSAPGTVTVANGGVPDLFKPNGAQVATNAETQALRVSVDNPGLRIILTVSEGWYRIVARRSAGIAKLADLRGKRIATFPNTSSAYYLHRMLATVGLSEKDVTILPTTKVQDMPGALERREVDAVTIWEPEIENAASLIGSDAIEFQDRKVYRELFNLHATAEQLADPAQRARIVAFTRSVIQASERIRRDPAEVWPLVSRSTRYDEKLIAKVWHHEGYPGLLVPDVLDVLEAEEVWVARERNRAPRPRAELAKLIDTSVAEEARRASR